MTDTPSERAESTWTKLRRRKVVQWGVVYVAAAWGFLQGLEYLSGTYDWPRQIQQYTTLVLLIGLPIVLVLAWYHGDRGQQRITTPEFAILTLLLLLGGGAFWYYQRASEAGRDAASTANAVQPDISSRPKDARPSIAVLPFDNRSDESKDAYFVDGIHDDILTQLSKVSALRVISRTSVERFRETEMSVQQIAQQLGVRNILEGGVQRAGDRIRINVQLIDADTDAHVWAERYDRELIPANVFAIQSELAAAIADALRATLTPDERARVDAVPTQSLEAWEAYQLGKQSMAKETTEGLADAERYFRKATELDAQFALAWVGIADTLQVQIVFSGRPRDAALDEAEKAVGRALDLNPNLAEAWTSLGGLAQERLQLERSEQLYRRAIALNANYAKAYQWLSQLLTTLGRRAEAVATAERAVALDPLSPIVNLNLGWARQNAGNFDDALLAFRHALEIDATMAYSYYSIADLFKRGYGRLDKASPWFEKAVTLDPGDVTGLTQLAQLHWELGNEDESSEWLSRAFAVGGETASTNTVAALRYLNNGDIEAARRHAQAAAELNPHVIYLLRDLDLLTNDFATARARYAEAFPALLAKQLPELTVYNAGAAIDLAVVLQHTGEAQRVDELLDQVDRYIRAAAIPRMGGLGLMDVEIYAIRGEKAKALAALREAENAGYRSNWRYHRDLNPALASIRNEPEFKAIFVDIERDMAEQRARLAARPKDAPLDLAGTGT